MTALSGTTSSLPPSPSYATDGQIAGSVLSIIGVILITLGAILRYYPGIGTTPMWIQIGSGLGSVFIGFCVYGASGEEDTSSPPHTTSLSTEQVATTRLSVAITGKQVKDVTFVLKELESSRTKISAYKAAWRQALQQYSASSSLGSSKQIAILEAILFYLKVDNLPPFLPSFLATQPQKAHEMATLLLKHKAPERVLTPLLAILSSDDRYDTTVGRLLAAGADPSKMQKPSAKNTLLKQASLRQALNPHSLPFQRAAFERALERYLQRDANALQEMRTLLTQAKAAVLPDTPLAERVRLDKAQANELALLLLEHNAPEPQLTPLLFLLVEEDTYHSTVERLLQAQADPDERDLSGKTALHLAANAPRVMATLLSHSDAAVNKHDNLGRYPLHEAVQHQNTAVIVALFQHGAKNLRHRNATPFQELVRPILTADQCVSALTSKQRELLRVFKPHVNVARELEGLLTSLKIQYDARNQRGKSTGDAVDNHTNATQNKNWLLTEISKL